MLPKQRQVEIRLNWFKHTQINNGNVAKTCRYYGISRKTYYKWRKRYKIYGAEGLKDRLKTPLNFPHKTKTEVESKILYLRKNYHFGPNILAMYMARYHKITICKGTIYSILKRNNVSKLPNNQKHASFHQKYKLYEKALPGNRVQIDVKFISPINGVTTKKYYQFTAIDDCTRIRVLKIYDKVNQESSINFLEYLLTNLPFKVEVIQTDNGSEFGTLFHLSVEEKGIRHVYIRPRTPRLNGKVERSHRIDKDEFYKRLTGYLIKDSDDFNKIILEWEKFYNFNRPHGSLDGKAPYEKLREKLELINV